MNKFICLLICLLLCPPFLWAGKKLPKKAPKYVLIVGFDGLSSQSIREVNPMPFLRQLMDGGCWTLTRRSVLPSSSAANWASLFMGAGPEQHGYNKWNSRKPDFPSDTLTEHGIFPDLYYQVKKQYPTAKIAHFYEWEGMHYVVDQQSVDEDRKFNSNEAGELESVLQYVVTQKPFITSIVFDHPDHEGHAKGHMTQEYFDAEKRMDNFLRQIIDAYKSAGMYDETMICVISDHGGVDKGHGGATMPEMEAPFVFYGKNIRQGIEIRQTTNAADFAPTVCNAIGVPYPHAWIGRPINIIFKK